MTEDIHWHCNGCAEDVVVAFAHHPQGWAFVMLGNDRDRPEFHYCPECWGRMLTTHEKLGEATLDHKIDRGELAHWVAAPMKDVGTFEQFHEVVARAENIIAERDRLRDQLAAIKPESREP